MLFDTTLTIAYKCAACGTFEFFTASLFQLLQGGKKKFYCRCCSSEMAISRENKKILRIDVPCIGCGSDHSFTVKAASLLKDGVQVFRCPNTLVQQCFIGSEESVGRKLDDVEKEFDALMDMFGFDDYFHNSRVMLDALNRIHDIAEQGNLMCQCGSNDIDLSLTSDQISLTCNKCREKLEISASSNKDLKHILNSKMILISDEALIERGPTTAEV